MRSVPCRSAHSMPVRAGPFGKMALSAGLRDPIKKLAPRSLSRRGGDGMPPSPLQDTFLQIMTANPTVYDMKGSDKLPPVVIPVAFPTGTPNSGLLRILKLTWFSRKPRQPYRFLRLILRGFMETSIKEIIAQIQPKTRYAQMLGSSLMARREFFKNTTTGEVT